MTNLLSEGLLRWARAAPQAAALVMPAGPITFAQMAQGVQQAAAWLHGKGVRAGDRVGCLWQDSSAQVQAQMELTCALAWLGATLLLIPQGAARANRPQFAAWLQVGWLLASTDADAKTVELPSGQICWIDDYLRWRALETPADTVPPLVEGPAALAFELTSGTTGVPKVVLHTHESYRAALGAAQSVLGFQAGDVLLGPMRWPTKVGWRSLMRSHLWGAAHLEVAAPRQWHELVALQERYGLTGMNLSVGQLRALLASAEPGAKLPRPLRVMNSAGAQVAPVDVERARRAICPAFQVVYASTETGIVAHLPADAAPTSGLRLVEGVTLRVCGAVAQQLPRGEVGRLQIQSPWMALQYEHNPAASAAAFSAAGFLSEDVGCLMPDGTLALMGRADDTINFGGVKVVPGDIEAVLMGHPAVADAAVVACAHPTEGHMPVAFVVFRTGTGGTPDVQALRSFLLSHLDQWNTPAALVGCASIARTPEGKVDRPRLQDLYATTSSVVARRNSRL